MLSVVPYVMILVQRWRHDCDLRHNMIRISLRPASTTWRPRLNERRNVERSLANVAR